MTEDNLNVSVLLCRQICEAVAASIQQYIDKQPSWSFFEAARIFDPRLVSSHDGLSHDIARYKAVPWLAKDASNHKLLEEWTIYVAQGQADLVGYAVCDASSVEHFDITRYWIDKRTSLPLLSAHALRALDVPVSSADVERAFSAYKKLVCPSRLALCDESVRVLHSAAWNGDITGRFEGFEH